MTTERVHKLKTVQPFFDDVKYGRKEFELRKDDRGFSVGDRLDLYEGTKDIHPDFELREHLHRYVKYKLTGGQYGLEEGYCILGLSMEPVL